MCSYRSSKELKGSYRYKEKADEEAVGRMLEGIGKVGREAKL